MAAAAEVEKVSFVCQRCLQPLRIDPSFYSMSEHTLAELSLPLSPAPDVDLDEATEAGKIDKYVPPFRLQDTLVLNTTEIPTSNKKSHGFTLVGESGQNVTLGNRLKSTAELFDIISNNGDVDHPLCEECTDTLLETMDQQLQVNFSKKKSSIDGILKIPTNLASIDIYI
jgi:beclin 1